MKKNVLRILSLVLVAVMLVACTACSQTILVRFVDKDGNDISFGGGAVVPAGNNDTATTPTAETPSVTPAADTTAAPAADTTAAPANTTPTPAAPAADTTAAPAAPANTTPAPAANTMPTTPQEIAEFYKKAIDRVKNNAEASYTKQEYQTLGELNITGVGFVDNALKGVVANYFKPKDQAEVQQAQKGTDSAKDKFPAFTLTDYSKIASASCTPNGDNYDIKIVMQDEDTPHASGSMLGQVTTSYLAWEDIEKELKSDTVSKILTSYDGVHILYKAFTITATITKDGKFVSMNHHANVSIQIGSAKILIATLTNKNVDMANDCDYASFQY